ARSSRATTPKTARTGATPSTLASPSPAAAARRPSAPAATSARPASTTSAASSRAAAPPTRTARIGCRARPGRASSPPTGPCTRDACDLNTHLCSNALIDPFAECKTCSVDTDCDVIGRCHGSACGPAGVCITVTALNCDDRQPYFRGVCGLDDAGQPRCTYLC